MFTFDFRWTVEGRRHFKVGDRVTLSEEGRRSYTWRKAVERRREGVVVGFGADRKYLVRVKWKGLKTKELLPWWFLKKIG